VYLPLAVQECSKRKDIHGRRERLRTGIKEARITERPDEQQFGPAPGWETLASTTSESGRPAFQCATDRQIVSTLCLHIATGDLGCRHQVSTSHELRACCWRPAPSPKKRCQSKEPNEKEISEPGRLGFLVQPANCHSVPLRRAQEFEAGSYDLQSVRAMLRNPFGEAVHQRSFESAE
jgi:hypothetical protein